MARKRKLPNGLVTIPGRRGYYARFRAPCGRRIVKKLGSDFDAAKAILIELRSRVQKAEFGLLDNNYPLAELQRQYLASCRQTLEASTVECYKHWLDTIVPALGVVKVSQISIAGIVAYREQRLAKGLSPRTVNAEVGALKTMLTWGVEPPAKLIGSNPIAEVEPLPHLHPREGRALSDDEVSRLLAKSPRHWRDVWYTFLVTGLRKSELAGLRFTSEFIDWDNRELIIPAWRAKGRRERRIPMDEGLYAILQRLEAGRAARQPGKGRGKVGTEQVQSRFSRDHVFVTTENTPLNNKANLWRAFAACLKNAEIERQTFDSDGRLLEHVDVHSLRRTFATNAIVSGVDPKTVQELLGHRTLDMTMKIYTKIHKQTKRQAIARLSYGAGASTPEHLRGIPSPFVKRLGNTTEIASQAVAAV
jgi:integrase